MKCECGSESFINIYAKYNVDNDSYDKILGEIPVIMDVLAQFVGHKCEECGMEYNLFKEQTEY